MLEAGDIRIGVIGGSGLYQMAGLEVAAERRLETPFGEPSDPYVIGTLEGKRVAFLPRHGRGHRLLPSELNYRANIYGFKLLGVEQLISVSAVGSMKLEYKPTDIVVPDQFYDRTRHRVDTFFGNGLVAHVSLAKPICPRLIDVGVEAARAAGATVHRGGTYVNMEGPQFSTRAESEIYRSHGVDVIGMTNLTEARLAREAEICYVSLSMITDYDCWHETEEAVSGESVMEVIGKNVIMSQEVVRQMVARLPEERHGCPCPDALRHSLITEHSRIPEATLHALAPLVGRYIRRAG
ncbi:MAG TPA: S-methyl-5'-thioadenosine phosphorylase [Thermoanaerobaculia bacterium]|jgi:5'-methylthioadenosine phosphorylase|nr:S-methyl-5'-thioadenosine phosphorylase [Thermoanaerobaculia bacterium]